MADGQLASLKEGIIQSYGGSLFPGGISKRYFLRPIVPNGPLAQSRLLNKIGQESRLGKVLCVMCLKYKTLTINGHSLSAGHRFLLCGWRAFPAPSGKWMCTQSGIVVSQIPTYQSNPVGRFLDFHVAILLLLGLIQNSNLQTHQLPK